MKKEKKKGKRKGEEEEEGTMEILPRFEFEFANDDSYMRYLYNDAFPKLEVFLKSKLKFDARYPSSASSRRRRYLVS